MGGMVRRYCRIWSFQLSSFLPSVLFHSTMIMSAGMGAAGVCGLFSLVGLAAGSVGDRSPYFRYCLDNCVRQNCSTERSLLRFNAEQSMAERWMGWSCVDECSYICMWLTVSQFEMDDRPVPQFYGKWPFVRWAGVQEPASVIFSLLNLLSNYYMLVICLSRLPIDAPFRILWLSYSATGTLSWFWSALYHARDLAWTEKMDYFCAFFTVIYGVYTSSVRILGSEGVRLTGSIGAALLSYFAWHVYYLTLVHFDYGYNMKANVIAGLTSSMSWLLWCSWQFFVHGQRYVWRCAVVVVAALSLLSLELFDFPPFFWSVDAHSLWHLGTAPLPLLWTRFVLDDCHRLIEEKRAGSIRKMS